MINRESIDSASALTERCDAQKLILVAVPDTPLAKLVMATRTDNVTVTSTQDGVTAVDAGFIQDMANKVDPETGICLHDQVIDEIAQTVIPAVRDHINFARTVVNPLVEELATKTTSVLNNLSINELAGAEIRVCETSAPYTNQALEGLISKYQGVAIDSPALIMNLPDLELDDIKELLKTGNSSLDKDVLEWLGTVGDDILSEVWSGVFQIKQIEPGMAFKKYFSDYMEDRECGGDYALVIFLLAYNLFNAPPTGTQMSIHQYETICADFRDQAANRIAREFERLDRVKKNGVLVENCNRLCVDVWGDVYRSWIEAGGDNDLLFGNALRDIPFTSVEQINANAESLKKAWEQRCQLVSVVERNRRFQTTKDLLAKHFVEQLVADGNGTTDLAESGGQEAVMKRFNAMMDEICEADLDNLFTLSLRLICCARYPHKAAYEILTGIDRNKRENPHLDVREAAMLSTFEYVFAWIASMIQPVRR